MSIDNEINNLIRTLSKLVSSSCSSFRQLECGFLSSRNIRREYSSRVTTRKSSEIRDLVRKMYVICTCYINESQIRKY